jgi:hypothetical protein
MQTRLRTAIHLQRLQLSPKKWHLALEVSTEVLWALLPTASMTAPIQTPLVALPCGVLRQHCVRSHLSARQAWRQRLSLLAVVLGAQLRAADSLQAPLQMLFVLEANVAVEEL